MRHERSLFSNERYKRVRRRRGGREKQRQPSPNDLLSFVETLFFFFSTKFFLLFFFSLVKMSSLRVAAGSTRNAPSSSTRAVAAQMTVGCPAMPPMAAHAPSSSRARRANPVVAVAVAAAGMPLPRRLAHSSVSTRAVRADAPTETLDPATVDAISSVTAAANDAHAAALARAKEEAASWAPAAAADASSLRAKVLNSVADVQQGLLEREVEVRIVFFFLSNMENWREEGRERRGRSAEARDNC